MCFLADPIAHVSKAFRERLLLEALSAIVLPKDKSSDKKVTQNVKDSWVDALAYLDIMNVCAEATEEPKEGGTYVLGSSNLPIHSRDDVGKWWAAVGMVAVHWLRGDEEAAERLYSTVGSVPKCLWNAEYVSLSLIVY